jgi:hypothetical protein
MQAHKKRLAIKMPVGFYGFDNSSYLASLRTIAGGKFYPGK